MPLSIPILAHVLVLTAPSLPPTSGDDLRELLVQVEDGGVAERRRAVEGLALIGGTRAWGAVLEALDDGESQVADAAQMALGRMGEEELVPRLLRREGLGAESELRRLRVAEALGRLPIPLDGERVLRAVDGRQPLLARRLLWSLERQLLAGRLEGKREDLADGLEPLLEGRRDGLLRADALRLRALLLEPERARGELMAARRDEEPAVRLAVLGTLARVDGRAARAAARELLADPVPGVRRAALGVLAGLGDREAFGALVERLEVEERPRLREAVVEVLRGWTGLKHREDPRPWRDHLARLPTDWTPGADVGNAGKVGSGAEAAQRSASVPLARLELEGRCTTFLVDFSGSTWDTRVSEAARDEGSAPTRKELLDLRMAALLERLEPDMEFNLVPYTDEPHPWREERTRATARSVADAVRFFERCRERGRGNVWSAIELALAEEGLETLVVLTDGVPTGGPHWDMELMVELWLHELRHRPVAVDVVLVDAPRRMLRHWERLARATGGRCLEVDLALP